MLCNFNISIKYSLCSDIFKVIVFFLKTKINGNTIRYEPDITITIQYNQQPLTKSIKAQLVRVVPRVHGFESRGVLICATHPVRGNAGNANTETLSSNAVSLKRQKLSTVVKTVSTRIEMQACI